MRIIGLLMILAASVCGQEVGIFGELFSCTFEKDMVVVAGEDHKAIFGIGNVYVFHSGFKAEPVKAEKIDERSMRIFYQVDGGKNEVTSVCSIDGNKIKMDYSLRIAPDRQKGVAGMSQSFRAYDRTAIDGVYKRGKWTRAEHNGVPYEKRAVYMKSIISGKLGFYMPVTGNHYYSAGGRCAMPIRERNGDVWRETLEISAFSGLKKFEAAARLDGEGAALDLSTAKRFNIFETGAPEFKLKVSGCGNEIDAARLNVVAYDYDGKKVVSEQKELSFKAGELKEFSYKLPDAGRNLYFVEAALKVGRDEYFTRTNVAVLPPYQYTHAEKSRLGLCGNIKIYDDPELAKLLNRIGVRYCRSGDNSKTAPLGIVSYQHRSVKPSPYDPGKDYKTLVRFVDELEKNQSPWFEFCNEWSGAGTARRNKEEKRLFADYYLQWLKALRAEIEKRGLKVKIMSVAIGGAGADTLFVDYLHDNGAWDLLDGIAFHPGRGNNVPDMTGSGWRYLGSVQNMRAKLKEYGGKPLFLTEVYAATKPNNWWGDSYRHAGENVLLSLALAYAEDVDVAFMFKWNEGVTYDVDGVNEDDREWNFGIMMRDGSPKPSMMGYAAAAEVLDGAEFKRYIKIDGTKINGMEFNTPHGKMAILYDRADGYWYEKKSDTFAHKEAWIDPWKSHKEYEFKSNAREVRVVDHIGRSRTLPVDNGKIKLKLSGEPLIIYGLEI